MKRILIYGFGNPGRQDDGLGVLLVEKLKDWVQTNQVQSVDFDSNYQLNIEDALTISGYELVIFADASVEEIESIELTRVVSSQKTEFTMHAMNPEFILHLCQSLYGKDPPTFLLHIKGYSFEFEADLSKKAYRNLQEAIMILKRIITYPEDPQKIIEKYTVTV